jgi:predicted RNase H-like nuclease (RuvC/YqgF family)
MKNWTGIVRDMSKAMTMIPSLLDEIHALTHEVEELKRENKELRQKLHKIEIDEDR